MMHRRHVTVVGYPLAATLFVLALAPFAHAAQVTAHVDPAVNLATIISQDVPQPGGIRPYQDTLNAGGSPVVLPFMGDASVISASSPDGADDTATLGLGLASDGFDATASLAAQDPGTAAVTTGGLSSVRFSVDQAVFYTISGSLSFTGDVGPRNLEATLARYSDSAVLYQQSVVSGASPLTLGGGTGQIVGALVAGQDYTFTGSIGLTGSPSASYAYTGSGLLSIDFVDAVDSDGDGVADDGDASGIVGDAPCVGGNDLLCDDNCVNDPNLNQADADANGVGDVCDGSPSTPVPALGLGALMALATGLIVFGAIAVRRPTRRA
jgi:hypothetical protein